MLIRLSQNGALADAATVSFLARGTTYFSIALGQGMLDVRIMDDILHTRVLALLFLSSWWAYGILRLVRVSALPARCSFDLTSRGVCS